jgi:PAS domain S-box-containing protein
MDRILEKFCNFAAQDPSLTLQVRLFRLMCLVTSGLCLLLVLPINLMQTGIPLAVNLADILLGLFALYFYEASKQGRHHIKTFLSVSIILLSAVWFLNGGITGSITYYFFTIIILPLTICRGWARWMFALVIVLSVACLFLCEYAHPEWVQHFTARSEWFLDNVTGMICSFTAILLVVWVIVSSYDLEQKLLSRYTKELALSEENYRGVVENAMSIILRMDRSGKITFFNQFAEELFGFKRAEIIGQHAVGTIVPATSTKGENLAVKLEELLQDPEKYAATENENMRRDGRRIWVNWTNQPIYDEQHQLKEILCVGADFTERVAMLEELRLTQITMDAAAEQIVWTNDQGKIIYANLAAVAGLGFSLVELHQLTLHDLFTDFPAAEWASRWEQFKHERAATFELTQKRRDQATRPVELSVTYIKVADKEYTTVFIRDLTGRKQAEEKRRQHEAEMQHLQRLESLGVLAGGIAHDFNNLLTAILANVSLIKMDALPGTETSELLGEAEKASLQARDLTAQLLTFARGGKPIKCAVNLARIIRDSTSFAMRGKPVKCTLQLAPDLWPAEADAAQLTQVFNNLVINACQAMPEGGPLIITARNRSIADGETHLVKAGDYLEVIVQDAGKGIAPEHLAKIFDPYFTTKKTGTGLGLAVVHSIVQNHQGAVVADSHLDQGTTFTLWLPASHENPPALTASGAVTPTSSRRVLVMDDEQMIRRVLEKILAKLDCTVQSVSDGRAALEAYQQALADRQPFDLVIMDLTVPGGMGGQETIRRLLEVDPRVKAIASSGYADSAVMADHTSFGFRGIITKPYTMEQIQAALKFTQGS